MTNTPALVILPCSRLSQSLIECHSTDSGKDIDAIGLATELNDVIDLQEIFALDAGMSKSEGFDNRHQFVGVLVVSGNKDIEIAGVTWSPMKRQRPCTDDHVLNTLCVQ